MTVETASDQGITAREYLRVSVDPDGRDKSTSDQHGQNREWAEREGWALAEPYREKGSASASRFARKTRQEYERLFTDLSAGRFGANLLVLWEGSRGSRDVGEWAPLLDVCQQQGVRIAVTTHGRVYDPSNARDRRFLLEDAVDSEYESAKTSMRILRATRANARDGKPHGRVPFGYRRRYDERTRAPLGQEPHPEQAPLVRELFGRIAEGHSLRSIALDWQRRGIVNGKGQPYSAQHLRSIATRATYAGERVHTVGGVPARRAGAETLVTEGQWPALVDQATYHQVQRRLSDPSRVTTRPGRGRHLLSMIGCCGVCGGPLAATSRGPEPQYQCHRSGCVRVVKADLDAFAEAAILAYLSREDVHAELATPADDAELDRVAGDLAKARVELDDLAHRVDIGALSMDFATRAEPGIRDRIAKLETRQRELSTPHELAALMHPGDDVAERWDRAEMPTRREVARLLLSERYLGQLRVQRAPARGHRGPIEERATLGRAADE